MTIISICVKILHTFHSIAETLLFLYIRNDEEKQLSITFLLRKRNNKLTKRIL